MRSWRLLLALATLVSGAACGPDDDRPTQTAPPRSVVPAGTYAGLAWLPEGRIVTGRNDGEGPSRLVSFREDGSELTVLDPPVVAGCRRTHYISPYSLADGRLSLTRICDPPVDAPVTETRYALVAWDLASEPEVLAEIPFDGEAVWKPDLSRGVAARSSDICATLMWVSHAGVEPWSLLVGEEAKQWKLSGEFDAQDVGDCRRFGRADQPAWTGAGDIAFFASPDSLGVQGHARLDVPWDLHVVSPSAPSAGAPVVTSIRYPRSLRTSPAGDRLAYGGFDARDTQGVWEYDVAMHRNRLVYTGDVDWLAWSPDGSRLALMTRASVDAERVGIAVVPIPPTSSPARTR
jgi:hypothetical protein